MLSLFCIHFFQCFDCAIPPVSSNPSCQSSGNLAYSQVARDPLPPAWHGWASPLSLWMTHRVPMGSWGLWSGSGPGSCDGRAMETIASFQSGLCQDCQCAVLDTAERVERFAHTMNPTPKLPESLELTKGREKARLHFKILVSHFQTHLVFINQNQKCRRRTIWSCSIPQSTNPPTIFATPK